MLCYSKEAKVLNSKVVPKPRLSLAGLLGSAMPEICENEAEEVETRITCILT